MWQLASRQGCVIIFLVQCATLCGNIGCMTTADNAISLGGLLEASRTAAGSPSYRNLERQLVMMLGEYAPSSETIRRLHAGKISPEQVDLVILAALCEIYGCTIKDVSATASARSKSARDLLERQSRCTARTRTPA